MRKARFALAVLALAVFAPGCAGFRVPNAALEEWAPDYGYRPQVVRKRNPIGEVALLMAFSGGGTRAAALSYGVLQELRDTPIPGTDRRLLDEIDVITSVSGGSFTSAYFGLFGDRIFQDYEERFLRRNFTRRLWLQLLNPVNWFRMLGSLSRTELAIKIYDRDVFDGSTFQDLIERPGPYLRINATDLSITEQFTFEQPVFDPICSDLSRLEVARAVAASSAVPLAFAPIILKNRAGSCGFALSEDARRALTDPNAPRRLRVLAEIRKSYLDHDHRRYIHLVDGGLVDNLGLRAILNDVALAGGITGRIEELGIDRPLDIVVVVVDAQVNPKKEFDLSPSSPGLRELVGLVTGSQLNHFSFETIELTRSSLEKWAEQLNQTRTGPPVKTHLIEVSFAMSDDPEERAYLNEVSTSFDLEKKQLDRLIEFGRRTFRTSPNTKSLLDRL